ncbi:murein transglycosylase [Lysobacter concretionis Ko07 = DSM 16239]|uniref:Murein transglycosylase n=1 Tax=Lysobacter concretionis Ko07 = DSM 16239 TaxID=1122185 RepID=A0A0A0ERY2_9GAMM|nr:MULTISPECIES: lytic murein transglycosylase B [Lysobacter]KGM52853.1 murein transglycosylase [Lysobacter concretionis Ko07 = DSM 16239]QOD91293.1 lytic murein transglycosylase B [Lysobacter sp. CW239]
MTRYLARRALVCALPLALVACATQTPPPNPQPRPAAVVEPAAPPQPAPAAVSNAQPVETALPEFVRATSAKYDVDAAYVRSVMEQAEIRDSIIKAMSRPAEAKPWSDYRPIFITQPRINAGKAFLAQHRDALARVEAEYGVPAEIIVAILGVETSYGGNAGSYPVVDALYTLAFAYPRTNQPDKIARENTREAFFRDELAQLFALGKETGFDITTLKGSYAGAMGWGQFMPSSYRDYAVDGNGDGKVDLFNNLDDVFASVANYFVKKGGWQRGEPVTVRAKRAKGAADFEPEGLEPRYTLDQLAARGYTPSVRAAHAGDVTLVNLDGVNGKEHWIAYQNFYAITRYNISKHYAMAVYQLSEAIAGRENPLAANAAAGQPGA